MAKEIAVCALEGCDETFLKRVHNQRYHSSECTRIATNKKILEAYHSRKNRDLKNRVCSYKDCGTILSVYNEGDRCALHERSV